MPIEQEEYWNQLGKLVDDSSYYFVVKQLAILAAMNKEDAAEKILAECYTKLDEYGT